VPPQDAARRNDEFVLWFGVGFGLLLLLRHPGVAAMTLLAVNALIGSSWRTIAPAARKHRFMVVRFLSVGGPLLIFYLYYRETAIVLNKPDLIWHDRVMQGLDRALGGGPASMPNLGELLALGYMTYVPLLLTALLVLWLRSGDAVAPTLLVHRICLSWAICYVVFVVYPVLGPRLLDVTFQEGRLGEGPFTALALYNQRYGMLRGAAFPSAHVAATTVVMSALWPVGPAFWLMSLPALIIPIAAYLLGYHYLTDILVGAVIGGAVVLLDTKCRDETRQEWSS